MRRLPLVLLAILSLAGCSSPKSSQPSSKQTSQFTVQAVKPGAPLGPQAKPQFVFLPWSQVVQLVRSGRVIQTVSGRGGFAVILDDHTWVRPTSSAKDPVPRNPQAFVMRWAPNATRIRATTE